MISISTLKSFLPTASMIKAGLVGAAGVAAVRMLEERVDIGVKITTGGKVGDSKLLPEIAHRNGVPLSLAVAPVVAAILVNKYL